MTDPRHGLGLAAETAVAAWLERSGWTILARRHRSDRGGEVDIVAVDRDGILVAIEVRARQSGRAGAAATSIDGRRVRRLERTLLDYAERSAVPHRGLRVDLVTVEPVLDPPDPARPRSWRVRRIGGIGSW